MAETKNDTSTPSPNPTPTPRVLERKDVSLPGRTIKVERLTISAQQVSSVTAALHYGKTSKNE